MKYANIENGTNKLLGWYDDSIHSEIPTPNIEVTDEVWQETLKINANCYENGKFIVKDFRAAKEIEESRVNAINQKANSIIYSKYSIEKQSSAQLGIYGDEYLVAMRVFIKQVIDISNNAIDDGISADEVDWEGLDK